MVTSAAAAASSSSAPPPPSSSALLAPGFRFHPTDEELVIYYLKRKVSGRPFRFHAIADVDLYKSEPWDLPSLSLLQTRDMEWYFFSPIDRKYSNRSRTNRATGLGYWKTTGKDRLIRHNSRLVGMKKTLVFHAGRAPRGDRTNWVMHEYRLDDEELARAGLAQVGYVVCRIFQKNGAGPQNGAQYGAPFVDEEWEETDPWVPQIENGGEYLELDDMELNQGLNVQHEDAALLLESNGEDGGSHQENPTTLLEEMLKNQNVIDGTDRFITLPELQGNPGAFNGMGENTGMTDQSHSPPSEKYGFVELNDLGETEDVDYLSSVDFVGDHRLIQNGHQSVNRKGVSSNVAVVHHIEEFFDTMEKNNDMPEPFHTVENNNYLQTNDLLKPMVAEDNVGFFDAPDDNLPTAQGSFGQTNNLMYPPMDDSCGLEMVDELMAYFDATADKLHYATLDSLETLKTVDSCILEQSNLTQEVDRGNSPTCEALPNPSEADIRRAASSSIIVPEIDNLSRGRNNDATITPDTQGNDGWNGAVTRYLVNMLGSISSPPAFAAEFPSKAGKFVGQNAATHSASSVHITAEMIQVKDLIVTGSVKPWSLQKNGDVGFLLSYGVTNNDVVAKSVNRKPVTKMHGGAMSVVLRGGFYLFFLSALILTASFKVGIYIYTK